MGSPLKDLQSSTCSVTTQIQRLPTYARANCPWETAEVHFTLAPQLPATIKLPAANRLPTRLSPRTGRPLPGCPLATSPALARRQQAACPPNARHTPAANKLPTRHSPRTCPLPTRCQLATRARVTGHQHAARHKKAAHSSLTPQLPATNKLPSANKPPAR